MLYFRGFQFFLYERCPFMLIGALSQSVNGVMIVSSFSKISWYLSCKLHPMKQICSGFNAYHTMFILFGLAVLVVSCNSYRFTQPQPVDKKNLELFPKELRGMWFNEEDRESGVWVEARYIGIVETDEEKIMPGEWPLLDDTGKFVYPANSLRGMKTIHYDSLKHATDTADNFILKNGVAYEINGYSKLLEKGHPYTTDSDSIVVQKKDTFFMDLGKNAVLRKLNKSFYVLCYDLNPRLEEKGWWEMVVIEKTDKNTLNLWYCSTKLETHASMFYESSGNFYYNSAWTAEEMLRLIKDNAFRPDCKLIRGSEYK